MHLSKIKLAGFKSFVDPTTIPIPSNLVGIIGPNGCGKSNIIDAVRWVLGESSAKTLRGDSMADVIFNGSSSRKPVGQASVEMFFDNSEGRIGGEYAQYNEISVKRRVSRDGQSNYYLNGTQCRRRDITDIFIGTGLGPRSYSIIEQGMISRLIEARPEELRTLLEEAAGISKYKERRRETERRMGHTRENLERLSDLRNELEKQLSHLQRQAKTAGKYKSLKEQERLYKGQLFVLRWQALDKSCQQINQRVTDGETQTEALVATQRTLEALIETFREEAFEKNEQFKQVQGEFYSHGSNVARVEQKIQHLKERHGQLHDDLKKAENNYQTLLEHQQQDHHKIETLTQEIQETEAQHAEQLLIAEQHTESLALAEAVMHNWQAEWEQLNQQLVEPAQQVKLQQKSIQQHNQLLQQCDQRQQKLETEHKNLTQNSAESEIQPLQASQQTLTTQVDALQNTLQTEQSTIQKQRENNQQLIDQRDELRQQRHILHGRHASLEALQQAALASEQDCEWLQRNELTEAKRLVSSLTVNQGWERAVELVLGFNLQAICVNNIALLITTEKPPTDQSLVLLETALPQHNMQVQHPRLIQQIESDYTLESLLGSVFIAEDLPEALTLRTTLASHESVITREGIWLGCNWLRMQDEASEKSGVIQREQMLLSIAEQLQVVNDNVHTLEQQLQHAAEKLQQQEQQRETDQQQFNQQSRELATIASQLSAQQARIEQNQQRIKHIDVEHEELHQQQQQIHHEQQTSQQQLANSLQQLDELSQQRDLLSTQRDGVQAHLEQMRDQTRFINETSHEYALRMQSMHSTLHSTEQGLVRIQQQLSQLNQQRDDLNSGLNQGDNLTCLQDELAEKLRLNSGVEVQLTEVRKKVGEIEHDLREKNSQRILAEQQLQTHRLEIEKLRIEAKTLQIHREALLEKINETGHSFPQLFDEMPNNADEKNWQQELDEIEQKIQRLGPINLAAIQEYEEHSERKRYLDEQDADLNSALDTLAAAIGKIDRETRARFKETFEEVNSGLQKNFPQLFGGGKAYLSLTGDDLLSTGVTVMAQPPGKRNSTIHLLSGGEKAMTAVALVFSIFELNPAPFCMLDEVDAPLDEANVGRFCEMVKTMSESVQFIFVSHNKATMEMAHQLNGVTMSEPGVSRIVAVNIQEAVESAGLPLSNDELNP